MPDLIGFVDSISAIPTTRLNLSDGTTWRILLKETNLSPAPLRRASSNNYFTDGDYVSASAYSDRVVTLALEILTPDVDTFGTQFQLLARELDRANNILRWWPAGATAPVFFETKRSDFDDVQQVYSGVTGALHMIKVPIQAKPFALGLRQTLSPTVVSNDPATGCYLDVPFPQGDVETPLYLSFQASDVIATGQRQTVLATRRRGTPGLAPWIIQAESMTRGSNTTLQAFDAAMSGTGQNFVRASSLGVSFATRLSGVLFGSTPGVDVRGKYRVYARVRQTNGTGEVRMRLVVSPDGTTEYIPDVNGVVLPGGTAIRWVDLGVISIPMGDDPAQDGPGGADLAARGVELRIQFALTANASNLDVDCFVGMPADDRFTRILWPGVSGPLTMTLDSSSRPKVYGIGASGEVYSTQIRGLDSGMPLISPNSYNRLWVLRDAGTTSTAGDDITGSTTITPYYYPRYAYLRPATT